MFVLCLRILQSALVYVFSELSSLYCEVDSPGDGETKPVGLRPERWCSQVEFATEAAS